MTKKFNINTNFSILLSFNLKFICSKHIQSCVSRGELEIKIAPGNFFSAEYNGNVIRKCYSNNKNIKLTKGIFSYFVGIADKNIIFNISRLK